MPRLRWKCRVPREERSRRAFNITMGALPARSVLMISCRSQPDRRIRPRSVLDGKYARGTRLEPFPCSEVGKRIARPPVASGRPGRRSLVRHADPGKGELPSPPEHTLCYRRRATEPWGNSLELGHSLSQNRVTVFRSACSTRGVAGARELRHQMTHQSTTKALKPRPITRVGRNHIEVPSRRASRCRIRSLRRLGPARDHLTA